jgi:hypothetical protein
VRKAAAVVCGVLAFAGAAAADGSLERQKVIVECIDGCDAVLPALRRMGAEIASADAKTGRVVVRIATERLPEIPMLKGVRGAFKVPATAKADPSTAVSRRRMAQERRRDVDVAVAPAPRLVAPSKGLALKASARQVRTAQTPGDAEAVQRSADVPAGTRELSFVLLWENDSRDDVDLILLEPNGNADVAGVTLRSPERAVVKNPEPGVWTAFVNGFAMNGRSDQWQLGVAADGVALPSR